MLLVVPLIRLSSYGMLVRMENKNAIFFVISHLIHRDLHTGQLMRTWRDHTGVITRVAIRDGGHTLVSASADGTPDSSFFCTWDESA